MKNLISKIKNWFKKAEPKTKAEFHNPITAAPVKIKKQGRGAYFKNNRRTTRGRNIQYVALPDGRTRVIRHETV